MWWLFACQQNLETKIDFDRDGYADTIDCDDSDPMVFPDAEEVCDGKDNNCDGQADEGYPLLTLFIDADGDAYGSEVTDPSCVAIPDFVWRVIAMMMTQIFFLMQQNIVMV